MGKLELLFAHSDAKFDDYLMQACAFTAVNSVNNTNVPVTGSGEYQIEKTWGRVHKMTLGISEDGGPVFTLQSGRLNATLDLRDSALTPRRGLLLQASGELTGALSASDEEQHQVTVNFTKVSGLATGYIPLGERVVVAVSVRAGRIFPLQAGSTTPPVRRFFLGGATSVRGFNEDQLIAQDDRERYRQQVRDCQVLASKVGCSSAANTVLAGRQVPSQGGELFAVGKLEVRFPAFSVFDFGVFAEAGNLWLAAPSAFALRPVIGAGLRYVTPIGPLALDVGYNLTADSQINEPPVVLHFNIGVF